MNWNLNDIATLLKIYFIVIYGFIILALDYAEIPHKTFSVLCILMTADIVTGVIKGYVLKELSSRPIITGMLRKTGLLLAIYFIFLGVSVIKEFGFIGNLALGMFILAELISILGNIMAVREKQKISEHDALVSMLDILKKVFKEKGSS
jgi:toxin secretion/phage lysis holin